MQAAAKDALQVTARAIFRATLRLPRAINSRDGEPATSPRERADHAPPGRRRGARQAPPELPPLEFFNGLGGFAAAGREYVTILDEGQWTPAPWTNVIANPQFGFLASADGTGTTWSINAQQNQLTPWSNDPVSNAPAEVDLSARRGQRRSVERDAAADSRADLLVCRASRLRLQPVRAHLPRHRIGAAAVRAAR